MQESPTPAEAGIPEWAISPLQRCLLYLDRAQRILDLSEKAIRDSKAMAETYVAAVPVLLRALEASRGQTPSADQAADIARGQRLADDFRDEAAVIARELSSGLPLLFELAAAGIWGSLEASLEDFCVLWLVNHRPSLAHPDIAKLRPRIPLAQFEQLDADGRMRILLREIKTEGKIRDDVDGFEDLFHLFGLGSAISGAVRRDLLELCEVRHLLLHRAGVADARFVQECRWMGLKVGDRLTIDRSAYERYRDAARAYLDLAFDRLKAKFEPE